MTIAGEGGRHMTDLMITTLISGQPFLSEIIANIEGSNKDVLGRGYGKHKMFAAFSCYGSCPELQ